MEMRSRGTSSVFVRPLSLLAFFCLVLTSLGLTIPAHLRADEAKRLRLAAPLALSGIGAEHSENLRKGMELAKIALEREGWKVEIAYEDTSAQAVKVVSAVQALLARGHRLFIGPTWSYMVAAAKPLLERNDAVTYSPITSSEVTAGPSPNIFHGVTKHRAKLDALDKWLQERRFSTAAIVVSETDWGSLHKGIFEDACRKSGVRIVLSKSYPLDAEEEVVRTLVGLMGNARPEVLLADLNKGGAAILLRRMGEQSLKFPVAGVDKMQDVFKQGLITADSQTPPLFVLEVPIQASFAQHYKSHYQEYPGAYSDSAYDGVMIFAKALSNTDGTPSAVRDYLHNQFSYQGASGLIAFDSNGDVMKAPWQVVRVN